MTTNKFNPNTFRPSKNDQASFRRLMKALERERAEKATVKK